MHILTVSLSILLYGLLPIFPAFAQAENAAPDNSGENALKLEDVVVTAEKTPTAFQTGDVDLETTAAGYSRITREAFEGRTVSLAEVIETEVGVQVRQSGGLGSFSSVSLRGSADDQVMVFLDGILLNDASGGGVDLGNISLSDVYAVEVYRGTTPVNFSQASIGGVVNIQTQRPQEGFKADLLAGYGAFNTRNLAGFLNAGQDRWDLLVSADMLASDNDFDILNDKQTEWNPADDRWEKRNNAQVKQYNLLTKAGVELTGETRIDLINQWFKKDQELPSRDNSPDTKAALDTERNITTLKLTANDLGPLHLNTGTQVSYTWKAEDYDDRNGDIGLGSQYNTYTTRKLGADLFAEWLPEGHAAILSAGFQRETYEIEDRLGKQKNPADNRRTTLSLGLQDSLFLLGERLIVTPACRYTWISDDLDEEAGVESQTRDESYFSPQVGLKYAPLSWLTLTGNLGRYFRVPSFFELFGDRGFFIGNPDLQEEKGINLDIGLAGLWQWDRPWLSRLSLSTAWFRNDVDDLITRVYDARGIGRSVNISGALIQGVEAAAAVDLHRFCRLILNATWQDPKNRSDIPAFDGKNLPGRFESAYLARLEATYEGLTLFGEYVVEKDMYYDTANLRKADDKEEINAGISYRYRSVKLTLEGRNLGDDLHEDFNGYPLPGRSFTATVKYDF
ncbi:TonB-dependent receptor [Desulfococcus sp.]|uniref:TonB-dependent receptor n=1 Tax=Desulfococcus sp. TaxID=2025834 RepID=UPI003D0D913D